MRDFGSRLAELRRAKGLTQVDLAQLASLHPGTIAAYEVGRLEPRLGSLVDLAKALDMTPAALVGETVPEEEARTA